MKSNKLTHAEGCVIDFANDTGAPTISPKNKLQSKVKIVIIYVDCLSINNYQQLILVHSVEIDNTKTLDK